MHDAITRTDRTLESFPEQYEPGVSFYARIKKMEEGSSATIHYFNNKGVYVGDIYVEKTGEETKFTLSFMGDTTYTLDGFRMAFRSLGGTFTSEDSLFEKPKRILQQAPHKLKDTDLDTVLKTIESKPGNYKIFFTVSDTNRKGEMLRVERFYADKGSINEVRIQFKSPQRVPEETITIDLTEKSREPEPDYPEEVQALLGTKLSREPNTKQAADYFSKKSHDVLFSLSGQHALSQIIEGIQKYPEHWTNHYYGIIKGASDLNVCIKVVNKDQEGTPELQIITSTGGYYPEIKTYSNQNDALEVLGDVILEKMAPSLMQQRFAKDKIKLHKVAPTLKRKQGTIQEIIKSFNEHPGNYAACYKPIDNTEIISLRVQRGFEEDENFLLIQVQTNEGFTVPYEINLDSAEGLPELPTELKLENIQLKAETQALPIKHHGNLLDVTPNTPSQSHSLSQPSTSPDQKNKTNLNKALMKLRKKMESLPHGGQNEPITIVDDSGEVIGDITITKSRKGVLFIGSKSPQITELIGEYPDLFGTVTNKLSQKEDWGISIPEGKGTSETPPATIICNYTELPQIIERNKGKKVKMDCVDRNNHSRTKHQIYLMPTGRIQLCDASSITDTFRNAQAAMDHCKKKQWSLSIPKKALPPKTNGNGASSPENPKKKARKKTELTPERKNLFKQAALNLEKQNSANE